MRVLVTRPVGQAAETVRALEAHGLEALVSPVLAIRFLEPALPGGPVGGVVATSANGLKALARLDGGRLRGHPVFTVGERTARTAEQLGFRRVEIVAASAPALAERLVAAWRNDRAPLLYAAGRDRTPALERRLAEAGLPVHAVELYAAEPVALLSEGARAAFEAGAVGAVLHMSRRSAEAFLAAAEASGVLGKVLVVLHAAISEKAAEPLRMAGAMRVAVAEDPTLAALLARLRAEAGLGYAGRGRNTGCGTDEGSDA